MTAEHCKPCFRTIEETRVSYLRETRHVTTIDLIANHFAHLKRTGTTGSLKLTVNSTEPKAHIAIGTALDQHQSVNILLVVIEI